METTSTGQFAEIVELSAVTSSSEFDQYVLPRNPITERAKAVTSLQKVGSVLFYKGNPVQTVDMSECGKRFLEWLDNNTNGKVVLYAHNGQGFDSRIICKVFREVGLEEALKKRVVGFSDVQKDLSWIKKLQTRKSLQTDSKVFLFCPQFVERCQSTALSR